MGKRSAEKQLTQLNQYDEDNEGDSQGNSFRRATEDALAGRVIRKPKSRLRTQPTPSVPAPTPAFAGFGGFGSRPTAAAAAATNSNSEESAAEEPAAMGVFKGFTFGQSTNSKGSTPAFVFGSGNASSAADKPDTSALQKPSTMAAGGFSFGSQGGSGFASFGKPSNKPTGSFGFKAAGSSAAEAPASNAFTLSKAPESAPKDTTASASADKPSGFSMSSFKPPTASTTTSTNLTTSKASGFSMSSFKPPAASTTTASKELVDKPKSGFSMPAFKPPTTSSSAGGGGDGGSSGKFDMPKAVYDPELIKSITGTDKVAVKPAKDSEERVKFYSNIRGLNASLQKKINDALQFNAFVNLTPLLSQYCDHWTKITGRQPLIPDSSTRELSKMSPMSIPSSTGPAPWGSKAGNPSGESEKAARPPPFAFSKFADGTSSGGSQTDSPARAPQTTAAVSDKSPKPFSFGFTSSASTGDSSASTAASKPAFSFSFDKDKQGQAGTSNSNVEQTKKPFSFSFGPAATSDSKSSQTGAAGQKPSFTFGFGNNTGSQSGNSNDAGPKSADTNGNDMSDIEEGGQAEEDGAREDVPKSPTTAGEEGETTVHQARVKLYQWDKEKKQYKDMGVGIFKLNTSTKDDGNMRARLLCRQIRTEKITLNLSMFKEMRVEYKGDKEVGLLGLVDGVPTRFMTRQKLPSDATLLKEAIDKVLGEL
ncbi:hypothetical protein H4R20_004238 [Coemansia guatemalensis]|uniref:RanBD1 domain-containing protein n=1 Tax=Coemansia guatemalensis TaxID=2761395 RepID=A0A9W8LRX5_9FUNG|nr:hypothetical protein H4R20_004238 [Coemansia guatemalensis]